MSFEDLITHGARDLVPMHIVKLEFLNNKFLTEVRAGSWTWSNIQAKFGPWILDDGIALPEDLAALFRSAFFTASFTDIITDYWAWPIQKYVFWTLRIILLGSFVTYRDDYPGTA